jgi:hypothetical protein
MLPLMMFLCRIEPSVTMQTANPEYRKEHVHVYDVICPIAVPFTVKKVMSCQVRFVSWSEVSLLLSVVQLKTEVQAITCRVWPHMLRASQLRNMSISGVVSKHKHRNKGVAFERKKKLYQVRQEERDAAQQCLKVIRGSVLLLKHEPHDCKSHSFTITAASGSLYLLASIYYQLYILKNQMNKQTEISGNTPYFRLCKHNETDHQKNS